MCHSLHIHECKCIMGKKVAEVRRGSLEQESGCFKSQGRLYLIYSARNSNCLNAQDLNTSVMNQCLAMDWNPVQGVPLLSRSQDHHDHVLEKQLWKMDGHYKIMSPELTYWVSFFLTLNSFTVLYPAIPPVSFCHPRRLLARANWERC